ncbi:hypothetical protein [Cohnella algarum]|uniref:hypothetical protein n=2 Tax=Cohnella TaxID=329857 RepID=UPI00196829D3|nr:hypothetical protein [Cohnella algarum]MBN2981971.1 hypothetical protein [Cohnella algarum]
MDLRAFEIQDYIYIPIKLASSNDGSVRDSFDIKTGECTRRWQTDVAFDGSLTWALSTNFSGFKSVFTTSIVHARDVLTQAFALKFDGSILSKVSTLAANMTAANQFITSATSTVFSVANTESGWGENYSPTAVEIKAFFYGWKMNDGNYGQPYNGSGVKTWVPWNAQDNSESVVIVPTITSKAITSGGSDYYRLSYQLTKTVTETVEGFEGAIGLHDGGNTIELLEGMIVREKIVPKQHSTNLNWYINEKGASSNVPDCPLQYRLDQPIAIYRNGIKDDGWVWKNDVNNQNGNQYASIPNAQFDPTAEYTVTYIALDRHKMTTNAVEATASYNTNQKTVVDSLVQKVTDVETTTGVNVNAIAELYKRVKALGADPMDMTTLREWLIQRGVSAQELDSFSEPPVLADLGQTILLVLQNGEASAELIMMLVAQVSALEARVAALEGGGANA